MNRYKLTISYDGTNYSGWQIQPNSPTVQEEIQRVLSRYCRSDVRIIGSGRTDAGVHATGQVAHFDHERELGERDLHSLNCMLPKAIRLKHLERVSDEFHALFSAERKIYSYHIYNAKEPGPFLYPFVTSVWNPIDCAKLKEAAELFIGRHDFASFANVCKHRLGKSSERMLFSIDVESQGPHITLTYEGEGFLYKMVRNLTGGLLLVATGEMSLERLKEIRDSKTRTREIPCAPASGLFLRRVEYGSEFRQALCEDDALERLKIDEGINENRSDLFSSNERARSL